MRGDNSEPDISTTKFSIFILILITSLIALIALTYLVSVSTGIRMLQLISVVEVPVSLAFSAILAYLYFRQANLMKGQQKLMELDYTPKLSLGELSVSGKDIDERKAGTINNSKLNMNIDEDTTYSVENLSIPLENIGQGVATELQLDLTTKSLEPEFEEIRRYSALQRPLELQDGHDYGYVSADRKKRPIAAHYHNNLASETHKKFEAIVTFRFPTNEDESEFVFLPFSCIIELLSKQGVERARLQMSIKYQDTIQGKYEMPIMTVDFQIENNDSLANVLAHGEMSYPNHLDEKMTGDHTSTVSEVNDWMLSEPNKEK
jgi:hypothetical protein